MNVTTTTFRTCFLAASLLLMAACNRDHKASKAAVNKAYESFGFHTQARAYPFTDIPYNALSSAWSHLQRMPEMATDSRAEGWESLGPWNVGGRTLCLAFNPQNANTLYAGSASGGLWRSYTAGVGRQAWTRIPIPFPVLAVSCIATSPTDSNTLYIGTGEVYNVGGAGLGGAFRSLRGSYGMGILKTTDGGKTWTKELDWSYQQQHGIWDIELDPKDPDVLWAATTQGIYKKDGLGAEWTRMLEVPMATDLLVHPDKPNTLLAACGNFQSTGYGIYKSTDGGQTWNKVETTLPSAWKGKVQLAFAPSKPDRVYASIGNGFEVNIDNASWLCRSDDFGSTFSIVNTTDFARWQGWYAHHLAVSPVNPDEFYVLGIAVWKSTNAGASLTQVSATGLGFNNPTIEGPDGGNRYVHDDAHFVVYHPTDPSIVYVANDGGIHYTKDASATWRSANGYYQTAQFYNGVSVSFQDPTRILGGLQDNGSILNTTGGRWNTVFGADGAGTATHPYNDSVAYISYYDLNVYQTVNRFRTLDYLEIPATGNNTFMCPFLQSPANPNLLFAAKTSIARSTDRGANWTELNGPSVQNPVFCLASSHQNEEVIYAATVPFGTERGGVYISKNGGESWENITGSLPDRYPTDIAVDPTNDGIVYVTWNGFGVPHVWKSEDYGKSWTNISLGLPDLPVNAVVVDSLAPAHVYIGTDLGVMVSINGGRDWERWDQDLPESTLVYDLVISPKNRKLICATHGSGAYQRDLLDADVNVGIHANQAGEPFGMFPNPAREFATVTLDAFEGRTILVYDTNGKLVHEGKAFAKQYELPIRRWPQGTYFVRVLSGARVQEQKLQVVH